MVGPKAYNFEAIRNFGFNQRNIESKNEFLLNLNQDKNVAYYAPIASQIGLQKMQTGGKQATNFVAVAPRSYTQKELDTRKEKLIDFGFKPGDVQVVKNRKAVFEAEKGQAGKALLSLFGKHIEERERLFEEVQEDLAMAGADEEPEEEDQDSEAPKKKRLTKVEDDDEEEDLFDDNQEMKNEEQKAASSEDDDLF